MADADQDQRTEPATAKKRGEAFAKGQFARSPDVAVAFILVTAVIVLKVYVPDVGRALRNYTVNTLQTVGTVQLSSELLIGRAHEALAQFAYAVAPMLIGCLIAAILAGGLQTRFRLTPEVLEFKPDKLNFVNGLKGLFSTASLMTMPFDLLKFLGIGVALWFAIRRVVADPLFHVPMPAAYLAQFLNRGSIVFLTWVSCAMAVIAAASYAHQWRKTEKDLRMTKQEVKDEFKQQEGDPKVKGHRRRLARRLMQRQMLDAVPNADVVVTNPTHYAVALKYERGKDKAPVVLAKGEARFALRIKALALQHNVPIIENKPVARLLFKLGEVGEVVPVEVYQAVAEILAFVYRTHRYYFHTLRARRAAAEALSA